MAVVVVVADFDLGPSPLHQPSLDTFVLASAQAARPGRGSMMMHENTLASTKTRMFREPARSHRPQTTRNKGYEKRIQLSELESEPDSFSATKGAVFVNYENKVSEISNWDFG